MTRFRDEVVPFEDMDGLVQAAELGELETFFDDEIRGLLVQILNVCMDVTMPKYFLKVVYRRLEDISTAIDNAKREIREASGV